MCERWILGILFAGTMFSPLSSQDQVEARLSKDGVELSYLLFVPKHGKGETLPLLLFLHGAGERGDDLSRMKKHGPPKMVETRKDFPFIVVSPQCPRGKWWEPTSLVALVDEVVRKHPVDVDRIYLTGLSMGGYGSWALAAEHPEKFAAVAPICGGGDPDTAGRIKDVPLWVFHGARDDVVPMSKSKAMVDALRKEGSDVEFTIYPEAKHNSWTETYANPALYEWFLRQRLSYRVPWKLAPAPIVRDEAPPARSLAELKAVLTAAGSAPVTASQRPLRIVLAAGRKDHGENEHDYPLWQKRWMALLSKAPGVTLSPAFYWPSEAQFQSADLIVFYSDNPGWSEARAKQLKNYLERGGGAVFLHFAVNGQDLPEPLAESIGLVWGKGAKYRHGALYLEFPDGAHPISKGIDKLHLVDESYWQLRGDPARIQVVATAVEDGAARPLLWTREQGKGRVFVSILGHYTWTFDDPIFRLILLRAMAWVAREDVSRWQDLSRVGARIAQ